MLNKLSYNLINALNESEEIEVNKKVFTENTYLNENCKECKDCEKEEKLEEEIETEEQKTELEERLASLKTQLEVDGEQLADDEKAAIQQEIAEIEAELDGAEVDDKIMNESAPGTDAYDKLVQGDDVYFRNEEGVALLGHYADNYPEPEEYDEGFKPEYGGTEEGLQKAKEAAANRDVWEFMEVFEDTLQPMNEVYAYVYGQDDLMEMLKTLRQVEVIKKLEEDQIEDARKDSIEKGLLSESEFKVGDTVKVPYRYGAYTPGEFIDAPIINITDDKFVTVEVPSKLELTTEQLAKFQKEALGECDKSLKEGYVEAFGGDAEDFAGDMEYIINEMKPLSMNAFGTKLAQQMIDDFIDTCKRQLAKAKRLASGDEFYSESEEPAGRKMTKAEFAKEFGEGCDVEIINAGREPEDRIEIVDECNIPIAEAEVKGLKEVKNQGNVYMLEDETNKFIVGENYNKEEGLIENAEIYESKEEADKDYLNRCDITGGSEETPTEV